MLIEPVGEKGMLSPQKTEPGKFNRSIPIMENPKD
jgi:hypothetical protein